MNHSTPHQLTHYENLTYGRRSHNHIASSTSPSPSHLGGTKTMNTTTNTTTATNHTPIGATMVNVIRIAILCTLLINSILSSWYGFTITTSNTTTTPSIVTTSTLDTTTNRDVLPVVRRRVSTQLQPEQEQERPSSTPPVEQVVSHRKSIIVTGAAGFVGSHVVEYLLSLQQIPSHENGNDDDDFQYDIIVIDEVNDYYDTTIKESNLLHLRNISSTLQGRDAAATMDASSISSKPSLYFYRGDICNTTLLDQIFTQHTNVVSICHMAARAGVRPSIENPYVYLHSNIIGTITLLQYAVQYKVQNFVFASSSSVYGGSTSTYFTETEPVDHPISPYAATKKSCELFSYVYAYQHQLNITALRFFTVYGPRGRPDMAPYKFIHAISNQIPIQQYGDGTSSRDYTYISDIVSGVVKSLLYHPSKYSIYNLGKGNGTTLNDFVHYVETYVNTTATIQLLPDQPGDVPYTCANITMAQVDLQYQPMVPFPNGIQQTVQWYQQRQVQQEQLLSLLASSSTNNADARTTNRLGRRTRRLSQQQQEVFPTATEVIQFDDEMIDPVPSMAMQHQYYHDDHQQRHYRHHRRRLQEVSNVIAPTLGYKKVAISGGISANPFVGRHVLEALLLRGDDVVLIDDDDDDSDTPSTSHSAALSALQHKYGGKTDDNRQDTTVGKLSIHLGRRNNSTFLEHVFHQEQPTHVIHFGLDKYAWSMDDVVDELERSKKYVQANVEILVRLFEVCKSGSKMTSSLNGNTEGTPVLKDKIQNFVFTSSDAVYGYEAALTKKDRHPAIVSSSDIGQYMLWNETDRVDYPKSSYGASMKSAELLGYTYHHLYNMPLSILRLFNIYGPHPTPMPFGPSFQLFDTLVKAKINDTSGSTIPDQDIWDTFDFSTMDYAYIDDIVQGIVSSIDRPYEYEIFNLGSGISNCIDGTTDLIRSIATEISLSEIQTGKILNDFHASLSLHSDRLVDGISCANIQKARDLLQYIPDMMTLQSESVKRTIEWHYEQSSLTLPVENNAALPLSILVTATVPIELTNDRPLIKEAGDNTLQSDNVIVVTTSSNVTKLCPTGVIVLITNHPNYPHWLRRLAFTQWIIVVILLIFRFSSRLRISFVSASVGGASAGATGGNIA